MQASKLDGASRIQFGPVASHMCNAGPPCARRAPRAAVGFMAHTHGELRVVEEAVCDILAEPGLVGGLTERTTAGNVPPPTALIVTNPIYIYRLQHERDAVLHTS